MDGLALNMGVGRSLFALSALAVLFACSSESIPGPGGGTPAAVASVDVSPGTTSLFAGRTLQLTATPKDAQGATLSGRVVTWSSNNSSVASVTNDGLASAVAFGSATITATSEGRSASATITVLHDPIVFVYGFQGSVGIWTTMIDRLRVDGWTDAPLVAWTYDSNQSNVTTAQRLQTTVDSLLAATGAKKVDIIAHSMGGLLSRYFSKNLTGSEKIDGFVFLGTPNHGTTLADLCPIQSCIEMRPGSGFLAALNAGDETPGTARYATWWTPCDQLTTPPESVVLEGATNTQTACMSHSDLYINSTVYAQVRDWVR
jgi:triacylglycerol lipase